MNPATYRQDIHERFWEIALLFISMFLGPQMNNKLEFDILQII